MELLTTNGTLREQLLDLYPANRRRVLSVVAWVADFVDSYSWIIFIGISLVCVLIRFPAIASRRLDHDELYTFYIAQAPSIGKMLALTRTVDLHPPLSYALVRLSFAVFGITSWSCRVPFAIAFVLTTVFQFQFLKNLLSPIYGLLAVLFLWSGPYSYNAIIARPYSLILCFTSLLLLSWSGAITGSELGSKLGSELGSDRGPDRGPYRGSDRHRVWMLAGVAIAGLGLLLSHVLGALCFAAIAVAEIWRAFYSRKPDWVLWIAFFAPTVATLTYLPLLKHRAVLLFTPVYRATPIRIFSCYWEPLRFVVLPLAIILVFVLAHHWKRKSPGLTLGALGRHFDRRSDGRLSARVNTISSAVFVALLGLYIVPLAVGIIFARTGTAFFDRYGVMMLIPAALAPPMVLAYGTRRNRGHASVVAATLVALICLNSFGRVWLLEELSAVAPAAFAGRLLYAVAAPPLPEVPELPTVPAYLSQQLPHAQPVSRLDSYRPDLSLVTGTALTFMELDHAENDAVTSRLFMLTNKEAASTIAHDTLFENYEQLKGVFPVRGNITGYCSFLAGHSHFLVLGAYNHPQGWLLRKLQIDGAQMKVAGTYPDTYQEHDLYDVTMTQLVCKPER